jgi:hypothetical protein
MSLPSTFVTIQNNVIAKVRLDPVNDLAKVKDWVNQTYMQVATETRCFQSIATSTLSAGVSSYTLDASILQIELITCTQVGGQSWFPLAEAQLDEILNLQAVSPTGTGPPRRYCLVPLSTLMVWPTPGEADTLTFYYTTLPTALSADSDLPAIPEPYASKLLEFGALIQAAEFKRDLMMLGDFQQQYAVWLAAFQRYVNRKAGAYPESFPSWTGNRRYGPHDPSTDLPDYAAWG